MFKIFSKIVFLFCMKLNCNKLSIYLFLKRGSFMFKKFNIFNFFKNFVESNDSIRKYQKYLLKRGEKMILFIVLEQSLIIFNQKFFNC